MGNWSLVRSKCFLHDYHRKADVSHIDTAWLWRYTHTQQKVRLSFLWTMERLLVVSTIDTDVGRLLEAGHLSAT